MASPPPGLRYLCGRRDVLRDVPDPHGPALHRQAVAAAVRRAGDGAVAPAQAGQQQEQGEEAEDGGIGIHGCGGWR